MPFTVITLKKSIPSLRGDLSKWMQEIATGVYVGNFNSKVRDELWTRVLDNIGEGEATISYAYRNEIGYNFETHNTQRSAVDSDGIPLIFIPASDNHSCIKEHDEYGFSDASKFHKAKKYTQFRKNDPAQTPYVVLDIETNGLNPTNDNIIEIGAIKLLGNTKVEFQSLIKYEGPLSQAIVELTGITTQMLVSEGRELIEVLDSLIEFIGDYPIVGFNVGFDIGFINHALKLNNKELLSNQVIDLLPIIKREKMFLPNYKLGTVLSSYGIEGEITHRALEDALKTYILSTKVKKFSEIIVKEGCK